MALGAVGIATEGTEAAVVVAEVEEVSGTQMKMSPVSLPAWSFCACFGGSLGLWCLVQQGGQNQEWFSWVEAMLLLLLLLGVEEPIFLMWSGAPGQSGVCIKMGCAWLCGCPESWYTHGWVG